jgi:hypothetical protein
MCCSCWPPQADLVKDAGHIYFIRFLDSGGDGGGGSGGDGGGASGLTNLDPTIRAQATFVLAAICDGHFKVQACMLLIGCQQRGPGLGC